LGFRQSEAARRLGVGDRILSLWECDQVYPTWPQQPKVTAFLGYDPFTNPALGRPWGNETGFVAFLVLEGFAGIGQQILRRRLQMKKNRQEIAQELGVSVKSLWGWETNRCQPGAHLRKRLEAFLGIELR
jgi:transcriptional regulator with XRE-family HTH domain